MTGHSKSVARLVALDQARPLDRMIAEGLVTPAPKTKRQLTGRRVKGKGTVSDPRGRTTSVLAYFDTSAVIPLVIDEPSSATCERLWDDATKVVSEEHGLRGYDAIHLAAARAIADEETVFVSGDRQLAGAAARLGLAVTSAG